MYTQGVMKNFLNILVVGLALSLGVSTLATAKEPAAGPAVQAEKKVDDFGLKDRMLSDNWRDALKLSKAQLESLKKLHATSSKEIEKLVEQGKTISHSHAPGEPCPGCAHAEKVREAYKRYHKSLGEILTANQENNLRKMVQKADNAAKTKA